MLTCRLLPVNLLINLQLISISRTDAFPPFCNHQSYWTYITGRLSISANYRAGQGNVLLIGVGKTWHNFQRLMCYSWFKDELPCSRLILKCNLACNYLLRSWQLSQFSWLEFVVVPHQVDCQSVFKYLKNWSLNVLIVLLVNMGRTCTFLLCWHILLGSMINGLSCNFFFYVSWSNFKVFQIILSKILRDFSVTRLSITFKGCDNFVYPSAVRWYFRKVYVVKFLQLDEYLTRKKYRHNFQSTQWCMTGMHQFQESTYLVRLCSLHPQQVTNQFCVHGEAW